jgi:hypothetical protein
MGNIVSSLLKISRHNPLSTICFTAASPIRRPVPFSLYAEIINLYSPFPVDFIPVLYHTRRLRFRPNPG